MAVVVAAEVVLVAWVGGFKVTEVSPCKQQCLYSIVKMSFNLVTVLTEPMK